MELVLDLTISEQEEQTGGDTFNGMVPGRRLDAVGFEDRFERGASDQAVVGGQIIGESS